MTLHNLINFRTLRPCGKMTERTRLFTGYACNIRCKFCFYRDMKHEDIRSKIRQQMLWGHDYGIKDWDISGGEPSILLYWFDIIRDLKAMNFRNIACITNGYKFADNDFLMKSVDLGLNELLFSLHGPNEEVHDGMTGVEGSFKKICKAIANSILADIKMRINVVVTKDNYKELPRIAEFAKTIEPVAFNFLPFRIEKNADAFNTVRYTDIAPYVKAAIDILNDDCKIAIRYVPFCVFRGYEKYVAGYLQREFDEYEWNEYLVRHFEAARFNKNIGGIDLNGDKWEQEIDALHHSIKYVANHAAKCLRCKYIHVCDGIWYSYADVWGINEFKPIEGDKTRRICL